MAQSLQVDSDDEIVMVDKDGAPIAAATHSAKTRRAGAIGRDRKATTLLTLFRTNEPRFLRALLAPVLPADLVSLCLAFGTVNAILQASGAADIWKRVRHNMPGPRAPPCPDSMSEMEYTSLLFVRKCQHCGKPTSRDVDWALRLRFCAACQTEHVKGARFVNTLGEVSVDVIKLVTCSKSAGKNAKNYWAPEVLSVHREITRLDADVENGDDDSRKKLKKFIKVRQKYVEEVLAFVPLGEDWQNEFKKAQKAGEGATQTELRKRVVAKIVDLGYRAEIVEAELPANLSDGVLTGTGIAWTRFLKKFQPKLDEVRNTLSIKVALLHEHYRAFLGGHIPRDWEALVPFGDISRIPEVQARLKDAGDEQVAALAKDITSIVDRWRAGVERQLLDLLPAGSRPADAASLRLATSVFVRGDEPTPQTYPRMLLGSHLKVIEFGPLLYATKQGPWTVEGLRYDALGARVVKDYCRYSGIEVTRATSAELDECPVRLQCTLCDDEWPLVFNWRHAIEHTHRYHVDDDGRPPSNLWRTSSVATERQVQVLEDDAEVWVCCLCPAASQGLHTKKNVKNHLEQRHHVAETVKGQDYRRAFTAPLQPPMTVLDVHSTYEDRGGAEKSFKCRHCPRKADLRSMLAHLKDEHSIKLKEDSAPRRLQTLPPQRLSDVERHTPRTSSPNRAGTDAHSSARKSASRQPIKEEDISPSTSRRARPAGSSVAPVSEDDVPLRALKRVGPAKPTSSSKPVSSASTTPAPRPPDSSQKEITALDLSSSSSDSEDDPTSTSVRRLGTAGRRSERPSAPRISLKRGSTELQRDDLTPPAKKRAISEAHGRETIDLTFSDISLPPEPSHHKSSDSSPTRRENSTIHANLHDEPPRGAARTTSPEQGLQEPEDEPDSSSDDSDSNMQSSEDDRGNEGASSSDEDSGMQVSEDDGGPVAATPPPARAAPAVAVHIRFSHGPSQDLQVQPANAQPMPLPTASVQSARPGFICKHCTGDPGPKGPRRFSKPGILNHLAVGHKIVSPRNREDYRFCQGASEATPTAKLPPRDARTGPIYLCKICHMRMHRFQWKALESHMALRHRIVTPLADTHYVETIPKEKSANPSLISRQRYICKECPAADKPRLLTMNGCKDHLSSVHGITKGIYRQHFDKLKYFPTAGPR